jgi:hypothetical protein
MVITWAWGNGEMRTVNVFNVFFCIF